MTPSPEQAIREALEPLARFAEVHDGPQGLGQIAPGGPQEDDYVWLCPSPGYPKIKTSDFRRARSAIPLLDQMEAERERMERESEEEANRIHELWSNHFWAVLKVLGIPDEAIDFSPGETAEETIGHIVGKVVSIIDEPDEWPEKWRTRFQRAALTDQEAPHEVREEETRRERIERLKPSVRRTVKSALAQDIAEAVLGNWIEAGDKRTQRDLLRSAADLALSLQQANETAAHEVREEGRREPDYARARLTYGPLSHDMLLQIIAEREAGIGFAGAPAPAPSSKAEPVAWVFELASRVDAETREPCRWNKPQLSFTPPNAGKGQRNVRPLFAHPAHVPEGYRLIPTDLTPEMLAAFQRGFIQQLHRRKRNPELESAEAAGLRAMLDAAPQPGGAR